MAKQNGDSERTHNALVLALLYVSPNLTRSLSLMTLIFWRQVHAGADRELSGIWLGDSQAELPQTKAQYKTCYLTLLCKT